MLVAGLVVGVLADQQIQAKFGHDDLEKIYQDLQQCDESEVGELLLRVTQEEIDSILAIAINRGHEKIVDKLLVMAKDFQEALVAAAKNGHERMVTRLLPRVKDDEWIIFNDALEAAAGNGHEKIVALLLSRITYVDGALRNAAENGHEKLVDMLLPRAKDVDGALAAAARSGHENIVTMLLPRAKDVDNALKCAVRDGHGKIFTRLLLQAQHVNKALLFAAENGHENIVARLLPRATDVDQALGYAARNGHEKIVTMLLPRAVSVDDALKIAAANGHEKVIAALLLKNDAMSNRNKAPLVENIMSICAVKNKLHYLLQQEHTRNAALLLGSFRDPDSIHTLLQDQENVQEEDIAQKTPTQVLYDKYIKHNREAIREVQELDTNSSAPLVGYYGSFEGIKSQLIQVEKDDKKEGYTTFVHGRNWGWNYVNDVWNIIRAIEGEMEILPTDISMRQRDNACQSKKLYEYRKKLVQKGIDRNDNYLQTCTKNEESERSEVVFMNYTGLSHLDAHMESSVPYALRNSSAALGADPYEFALQLLKKHALEKHESLFKQLFEKHRQASEIGELLCISVKNEKLDEIVYPAVPGGIHIGQKTSQSIALWHTNVFENIDYFPKWVNRSPIFCAAALSIPGEGPDVYKIRSVTVTDSKKYEAYVAARHALFEQLKKDKKDR